jgi:hypothetical protein
MKRVINGKVFDTGTAELLGTFRFGSPGDINYVNESLYRTKRGVFFLAGEGGANTKYSQQVDNNSWSGGRTIFLLTIEEALEWAETHDVSVEIIEKYFQLEEA